MSTTTMSQQNCRVVLILIGLVGSGKSTFAEALESFFPTFCRCNQDDLGSRKKVEAAAEAGLRQGYSICIDRTNFDASQRAHFIRIAQSFPDTQVWGLVFDTPYQICVDRLETRTGHPTITSPELGLQVLRRFASDYRPPIPEEGFDRIYHMSPHPTGKYTKEDVASVLHNIAISPSCQEDINPTRDSLRFFRTNGPQSGSYYRGSIGNPYYSASNVQ